MIKNYKITAFILGLTLLTIYFLGCGSSSMKKAKDLVEVGMYEEAIPLLEMEIQENPKNAEAHFLLGKIYLDTGEEENARLSFERAVITDANFMKKVTEEYKEYGLTLLEKGRLDQAEEIFDQAVNFNSDAREKIVEVLIQYGKEIAGSNIEDSNWCFKQALNYSEEDKDNIGIECLNLAENFLVQNKIDESISFAELARKVLGEKFEKEGQNYLIKLQETAPPIKAVVDIPRLIKRVWPIYPENAREQRVSGGVALEVTTDIRGKVKNVELIKSIPLLDQAAIDAVRKWEYEPKLINGIPRAITFKTIVPFVILYINKDGTMYVNKDLVTRETLADMLDQAFFINSGIKLYIVTERSLYLRVDQDTPWREIIDGIKIIKDAKIEEIGIIDEKEPRKILDVILPETSADISAVPWFQGHLKAPVEIPEEIKSYFILTTYKGVVLINQEQIEFNMLRIRLKSIYDTHKNIPVFIRANAKALFKYVVELINVVKEAGFDTIGIIPEYVLE